MTSFSLRAVRLRPGEEWRDEQEVTKQAERAAEDIIEDARSREREIRLGAEDYADEILNTLEVNLDKFLTAVRRGRERLHERSQETVIAGIGPEPSAGPLDAEELERL